MHARGLKYTFNCYDEYNYKDPIQNKNDETFTFKCHSV